MTRGISTVLDAAVFLLLVSLAATTLVVPTGPAPAPSDEPAATVVARTTAAVDYSLAPGARGAPDRFPRVDGTFERHASGRLAALLARAAVRNATVDGTQLTRASDGYERAVAAAVGNATGPRTTVVAAWRPFPGAGVRGQVRAGATPPPDASVAAATLTVETRGGDARARALAAADRSGYAGVARVLAAATVRTLLPREGMANALAADYPTDRLAVRRYRRAGDLFGVHLDDAVVAGDAAAANDRLRAAVATRFERRLRAQFDSPSAAARRVRAGRVDIVVRRWSA